MITPEQSVIILGPMGAGKTTVGEALAEHYSMRCVDTDKLLEAATGYSCAELVNNGKFADSQLAVILGFTPLFPSIIPTGGSVATNPKLVEHLRQFGAFVTLLPTLQAQRARLSDDRIRALNLSPQVLASFNGREPSLDEKLAAVYADREPTYRGLGGILIEVPDTETPERTIGRVITALTDY